MGLEKLVDKWVISTDDFIGSILANSRGKETIEAEILSKQDHLADKLLKVSYGGKEGYIPLQSAIFMVEGKDYSLSSLGNVLNKMNEGTLNLVSRDNGEKYEKIDITNHKNIRLHMGTLRYYYEMDHPNITKLYHLAERISKSFSVFIETARNIYCSLTKTSI